MINELLSCFSMKINLIINIQVMQNSQLCEHLNDNV